MIWIRAGLARLTPGSWSVSLPLVTVGEVGCCEGLISAKRTFGIVLQLLLEKAGEEGLSSVASSVTTQGGHFFRGAGQTSTHPFDRDVSVHSG